MFSLRTSIEWARSQTAAALGELSSAANRVDRLAQRHPEHADQLRDISARLWPLTGPAREIEAALAEIHSKIRSAT